MCLRLQIPCRVGIIPKPSKSDKTLSFEGLFLSPQNNCKFSKNILTKHRKSDIIIIRWVCCCSSVGRALPW